MRLWCPRTLNGTINESSCRQETSAQKSFSSISSENQGNGDNSNLIGNLDANFAELLPHLRASFLDRRTEDLAAATIALSQFKQNLSEVEAELENYQRVRRKMGLAVPGKISIPILLPRAVSF